MSDSDKGALEKFRDAFLQFFNNMLQGFLAIFRKKDSKSDQPIEQAAYKGKLYETLDSAIEGLDGAELGSRNENDCYKKILESFKKEFEQEINQVEQKIKQVKQEIDENKSLTTDDKQIRSDLFDANHSNSSGKEHTIAFSNIHLYVLYRKIEDNKKTPQEKKLQMKKLYKYLPAFERVLNQSSQNNTQFIRMKERLELASKGEELPPLVSNPLPSASDSLRQQVERLPRYKDMMKRVDGARSRKRLENDNTGHLKEVIKSQLPPPPKSLPPKLPASSKKPPRKPPEGLKVKGAQKPPQSPPPLPKRK